MRIITLFFLSCLLCACQQAFELPYVPDAPAHLNLTAQTKKAPVIVDSVTIDMPQGVSYLAYPYWRWQYDHLKMSLWDACNAQLRYRLFDSTEQWRADVNVFGTWKNDAALFINNALTEMGYQVLENSPTNSNKPALLLKATIERMRGNMCHTTPLPLLQNGGLSAGDIFIHVRWQLYDSTSNQPLNTFESDGIGYVEEPQTNGNKLVLLNALKNAALHLGGQPEFADTLHLFQKSTRF